jgi:hypothetical protein
MIQARKRVEEVHSSKRFLQVVKRSMNARINCDHKNQESSVAGSKKQCSRIDAREQINEDIGGLK